MSEVATSGMESGAMSKVQKSLLINEDLVRLLDAHAKRKGASFTRQVTAAVLQYLFTEPSGPQEIWMQYAVGLDDGEFTVGDMPAKREEDLDLELEVVRQADQKFIAEHRQNFPEKELVKLLRAFESTGYEGARRSAQDEWEAMGGRSEKDPVDRIVAHWDLPPHRGYRTPDHL